jgi:carbon-monoxide dehydrogenase medium subunit
MPLRAAAVEAMLQGQQPDAGTLRRASAEAARQVDALEDIHASAEYRLHLCTVMTRRALEAAVARART